MTESASTENRLLTNLLSITFGPFKVVSATPDTVLGNDNGIHNTMSRNRVTSAPYKGRSNDRTDRDSHTQGQSHHRNEDGTDENKADIMEEFQLQHIVKHVGAGKRMKYNVRWCGYGPDEKIVGPLQNILQHFIASYWSVLNRPKVQNGEIDANKLYGRTTSLTDYCSMRCSIKTLESGSKEAKRFEGKATINHSHYIRVAPQ